MANEYMDIIVGSNGTGKFLENANNDIIKIVGSLEAMNDPSQLPNLKGMDFLHHYIRDLEGIQGHTEGVREYRVWAVEDGSYQDADTYNEAHKVWRFGRKGYTIKDKDFSGKMLREARERREDLSKLVAQKMDAIQDLYTNEYLPNIAYATLFELPNARAKADYYGEPMGFLQDTVVYEDMLKPAKRRTANLTRNHYRSIAGEVVELEDVFAAVSYLTEYRDVSGSNIVGLANDFTKFKLINATAADVNRDIFARTGQPTDIIAGVKFISNDFMPDDLILFLVGDAKQLITKLISPDPGMRGMSIVKEDSFKQLSNIYDLVGSQFKIQPEGYHLTGRHYGLFLDISGNGTLADPVKGIGYGGAPADRLPVMTQEQLDMLIDFKTQLDESWKVSIGG